MPNRARDWFAQAERDLDQARASRRDGRHEWACFAAHQAAEKAVKAVHLVRGQEASGPVVAQLLSELPLDVPTDLIDHARLLDNFLRTHALSERPSVGSSLRALRCAAKRSGNRLCQS